MPDVVTSLHGYSLVAVNFFCGWELFNIDSDGDDGDVFLVCTKIDESGFECV